MISIKENEEEVFAELMEKTLMQIPLYTSEWTNFNASDPGITILESLGAVHILQQQRINSVSENVQKQLLRMVGFEQEESSCAKILLQPSNVEEDALIPEHQRFLVDQIPFETETPVYLTTNRLTAVYSHTSMGWMDCSSILHPEIPLQVEIFGRHPAKEDALYLVMEQPPEPGQELIFYASTPDSKLRNPASDRMELNFARITWSLYTEKGFQKIQAEDDTSCFIFDGKIRLKMPVEAAAEYGETPVSGYVIRGTLVEAQYDLVPKLNTLAGFLFEVVQHDTSAILFEKEACSEIRLYCELLEEGYIQLFVREKGSDRYLKYEESMTPELTQRTYSSKKFGHSLYQFLIEDSCLPGEDVQKDGVKIVAYSPEAMRNYEIGRVEGYDDQIIALPMQHVVEERFCLIALCTDRDGRAEYQFFTPGCQEEEALFYTLDGEKGELCIMDAGDYIGARLFLGNLCTSQGEDGNILPYNQFVPEGKQTAIVFTNPAHGEGGRFRESLEDTRLRFQADLKHSYTAVKESEYEDIVKQIPALCIHKVKAIVDYKKQQVSVVVKPWSNEEFPALSALYIRTIEAYLAPRRILSTRLRVIQPAYVPVDVNGTIYIKKHYESCREEIEQVITERLDYVNGTQNFGELLKFDDIFQRVEKIDGVEYIYELTLTPQNHKLARKIGMDVKPDDNCLCYPGKFYLEINTYMD